MRIDQLSQIMGTQSTTKKNEDVDAGSFKNMIYGQLNKIDNLENVANTKMEQYATGEIDNVQDVLLAIEDMKMNLEFATEVRNKMIDAYQELNRIQL